MPSVLDVAAYILKQQSPMTTMKLQKLVYYSQAWYLVWEDEPLFQERIEAWANGPVVRELYDAHRGSYNVTFGELPGNANALSKKHRKAVDLVLKFYGHRSSQWLSSLTHAEDPWKDARKGILPGQRSDREITLASLAEYYSSLT